MGQEITELYTEKLMSYPELLRITEKKTLQLNQIYIWTNLEIPDNKIN